MNILFLTLASMEDINERGIYTDLVRELARRGTNVYVVFPRERRKGLSTEILTSENIKLLKVKTGNITQTNFVEKGISTLTIENQFLNAIKKYFPDVRFDLVMYSTPPITFERIVSYFKRNHHSKTYLILKDIFPQNALDIGILRDGSLIWKYFRNKEKKLYKVSDMIGCMSKGNVEYVLDKNKFIPNNKVEIFANSIEVNEVKPKKSKEYLARYNIPPDSTLFVYGGNLGKPQGIDFILDVVDHFYKIKNGYLLIVGSGTEYQTIKNHLDFSKPKNVSLFEFLPKNEYDLLLEMADVGLIFLDKRFTIPNFPSRLTAYMEFSLPILAATDSHTDLRNVLLESNSGLWSESGDLEGFIENSQKLATNNMLRELMGCNGRKYLEDNFDIRKTVDIITNHL